MRGRVVATTLGNIRVAILLGLTVDDRPVDLARLTVGEQQLLASLIEKALNPTAQGELRLDVPRRR